MVKVLEQLHDLGMWQRAMTAGVVSGAFRALCFSSGGWTVAATTTATSIFVQTLTAIRGNQRAKQIIEEASKKNNGEVAKTYAICQQETFEVANILHVVSTVVTNVLLGGQNIAETTKLGIGAIASLGSCLVGTHVVKASAFIRA